LDKPREELGRGIAKEIGITPKLIEYIEARGFLCHELLYLLDGQIEFIFTPWWQLFRRLGNSLFGAFPVCRWYPPEGTILEWVGCHSHCETKVYRLTITQNDKVVFFVEYQPDNDSGMFFPCNVPWLVQEMFLRPPFEKNREIISKKLRDSINRHQQVFEPIMTKEESRAGLHLDEIDKGLWDGFTQIASKDEQKQ
jgi:hypothetical protein